jgi:hypothetical protein
MRRLVPVPDGYRAMDDREAFNHRDRRRAHPGDLSEIEEAQVEARGARYAPANQRMIDR